MYHIELEVEQITTGMAAFMKDNGITYNPLGFWGINFPAYDFQGEKADLENFLKVCFPNEPKEAYEFISKIE